jgi:hypothetical protein
MAGQSITNSGGPVVADDGVLKTFQATGSQYNDSSLFGTPGGTKVGLASGETPASVGIGPQYYGAPNGPTNQQVNAFANDLLQQAATPNGAVTPVYPAESVVLGNMAGKIAAGALGAVFGSGAESATQAVATNTTNAATQDAYSFYTQQAQTLNVSTAPSTAVFYSGPGNRALAEEFATTNGSTTLEMTPGGSWLDQQTLFGPNSPLTPEQALNVWSTLSQRYAASASGNVVGFVQGARPTGIFNTVEYPALLNNPSVTNVITNGH